MRVTLIHNPGAGQQEGGTKALLGLLRDAGHTVRYQSAKAENWAEALDEPADLVAVAGGDGTVSRVAKRMVGRGVPVAPLPAGTANNISRTLGLVGRHWEELVHAWGEPHARRVKLDVGVATGPWGRRDFVEGVGLGLFACQLGRDPKEDAPPPQKPAAKVDYALQLLKDRIESCEPVELEASLDGKDISGRYLLLEAVNLCYVGPSLFLAPDSRPGDGTLDVVLVSEAERDRLREYLSRWQDNRERLAVLPTHRGKRLAMTWSGFELHIDDQLWPENGERPKEAPGAIEVRIEDACVEFLAPAAKEK